MGGEISYENKQNKSRVKLSACNRQPTKKKRKKKFEKKLICRSSTKPFTCSLSPSSITRAAQNLLAFSWFQESVQLKNVTQMFQNLERSVLGLQKYANIRPCSVHVGRVPKFQKRSITSKTPW